MKRSCLLFILVVTCCITTHAHGQNYTRKGATLGGLAGALSGAAIGKHNGDTAAGALIGGALGLITGAALGNTKDEDVAQAWDYQQRTLVQMSRAVSTADVVNMTQNGISEHVIVSHIQRNGLQRPIQVSEVIALHKQGVSETVITAMERAPVATAPPVAVPRYHAPVIVEEHHYIAPPYVHRRHRHYYRHHLHHPGVHWGISFGH